MLIDKWEDESVSVSAEEEEEVVVVEEQIKLLQGSWNLTKAARRDLASLEP